MFELEFYVPVNTAKVMPRSCQASQLTYSHFSWPGLVNQHLCTYRIRPNYRTVRLGFSKLMGTLSCGKICIYLLRVHYKQEAHGPRFAHLSDIATADMQMLCNIYPILSLQLMKISSFEQFLVLKKNIWAWQSMEHDHE